MLTSKKDFESSKIRFSANLQACQSAICSSFPRLNYIPSKIMSRPLGEGIFTYTDDGDANDVSSLEVNYLQDIGDFPLGPQFVTDFPQTFPIAEGHIFNLQSAELLPPPPIQNTLEDYNYFDQISFYASGTISPSDCRSQNL